MVKALSFAVTEPLLITVPSGIGKSSLVKAIAGLWQTGQGTIICPQQIAFIPQRPYLPPGSLKNLLLYPFSASFSRPTEPSQLNHQTTQLRQVLAQVNLPSLLNHSLESPLTQPLSLGEQQRLAFARLLLHSPKYAILDEATSALDLTNETRLYQKLQQNAITPISVGHRPSLKCHHRQLLILSTDGS